jgi:hypothetical protein
MQKGAFISALLLLTLLGASACQPLSSTPPPETTAGMEMFLPAKMRLHPLSRIVASASNATLEARLELTDSFGDIGKGVGSATFKLFTYSALMPNHQGSTLGQWHFDLSTPTANHDHWDAITRTYLFKLPLTPASLNNVGRVQLTANLTLPDGTNLLDSLTLPTK